MMNLKTPPKTRNLKKISMLKKKGKKNKKGKALVALPTVKLPTISSKATGKAMTSATQDMASGFKPSTRGGRRF